MDREGFGRWLGAEGNVPLRSGTGEEKRHVQVPSSEFRVQSSEMEAQRLTMRDPVSPVLRSRGMMGKLKHWHH